MTLTIPAPHPDAGSAAVDRAASSNRVLYRVPEAMRLLSLSRSMIYNQIRAGRLRSVKEGSSRLIPAEAISDYVALLKAEAEADR
jgi:excisionase family DNA binding protein